MIHAIPAYVIAKNDVGQVKVINYLLGMVS